MAVDFKILRERGLVVVCFSGHATIDEMVAATKTYLSHPDYAKGQKQLVDLTDILSFEKDYVRFMNIQASKAERLAHIPGQTIAVYLAPTPVSREVCAMFVRSWTEVGLVVPLVQNTEAEALAILGQPETSIEMLFSLAAR